MVALRSEGRGLTASIETGSGERVPIDRMHCHGRHTRQGCRDTPKAGGAHRWRGPSTSCGEAPELTSRTPEFRGTRTCPHCEGRCGELHGCNTLPCGRVRCRAQDVVCSCAGGHPPEQQQTPAWVFQSRAVTAHDARRSFLGPSAHRGLLHQIGATKWSPSPAELTVPTGTSIASRRRPILRFCHHAVGRVGGPVRGASSRRLHLLSRPLRPHPCGRILSLPLTRGASFADAALPIRKERAQ